MPSKTLRSCPARNEAMIQADGMTIKRFWSYVEKTKKCWHWTGPCDGSGYGFFSLGKGLSVRAHRFSLIQHTKATPPLWALHSCLSKNCVNPNHLRWGNAVENAADRQRDGTVPDVAGEANPASILTAKQVKIIWSRLLRGDKDKSVSKELKINSWQVAHIRRGKTWASVTENLEPLPRSRQKLTSEEAQEIYAFVQKTGCTDADAGHVFKVHPKTVMGIVTKATWRADTAHLPPIPKRYKRSLYDRREDVENLWRQNYSVMDITRQLGVSRRYVRYLIEKENWTRQYRPRNQWG